jgi:methyl-accepting chemotaxis protein
MSEFNDLENETNIIECIEALAHGNYDRVIEGDGAIFGSLRSLAKSLSSGARDDLVNTVRFSMNASEAMTSVSQMTGDVRETDQRTQIMAAAVEELTASIQQVSQSSTSSASEAEAAREASRAGISRVSEAINGMDQVSDAVGSIESRLTALGEASSQIEGILETIEAIAKQTNLLALNATIEAARAGEHGKGFAVVAGEVKLLANQTANATEDIRQRISQLNTEMTGLTNEMETCSKAVTTGKTAIDETGKDIGSIDQKVENVSSQMSEIAHMLSEQSIGVQEIGKGVHGISEITDRNRLNAETTIKAVGDAEALIAEQFEKLDNLSISDYVLYRAKSDHFIWKKNLAEMFVGLNNLTEAELADHHSCRLGKWYDQMTDTDFTDNPVFKSLIEPHSRVHTHGKTAAQLHSGGERDEAEKFFIQMEEASTEVVALLDQLISQRQN